MIKKLLITIALLFGATAAQAQNFLAPEQAFQVSAEYQSKQEIVLNVKPAKGYYIYRESIKFKLVKNNGDLSLGAPQLPQGKIKFDENFGAGVPNYLGDEYIFIADALRSGLKGVFAPILIAIHPTESSGNLRNLTTDRSARAKVFSRVFGIWSPVMRALFLAKPPSKKFGFINSLLFIIGK